MTLLGSGILAIWNDIAPDQEADYHDWYRRDHFPDRLAIPGFRRGRRYAAIDAAPRYFTFYETADVDVLTSPAYLARLEAPTPWTRRVMPHFRNMNRTPCRVVASLGEGEGGVALAIRLAPRAGAAEALDAALGRDLLPGARAAPEIVAAHLWAAAAAPPAPVAETALRGGPDASIERAIVVEAMRPEALAPLVTGALSPERLAAAGARPGAVAGIYRLLHGLAAPG